MQPDQLRSILQSVAAGTRTVEAALDDLRDLPYEDLGFARLDHHRSLRTGVPEVIFGQGKTPAQIVSIINRFVARSGRAIVTRISPEAVAAVKAGYPQALHAELARMLTVGDFPAPAATPF